MNVQIVVENLKEKHIENTSQYVKEYFKEKKMLKYQKIQILKIQKIKIQKLKNHQEKNPNGKIKVVN